MPRDADGAARTEAIAGHGLGRVRVSPTTGSRLRCDDCGSEFIITRALEPDLTCCQQSLVPVDVPGTAAANPERRKAE